MTKKKSNRSHGHYCKICGEYKANEKFSGRGHAAHICKACSRLSAAEKAEAQTINRLMNFSVGRLSANEKTWLENRLKDRRPEVAELAREVYRLHFPYAERNTRKKQLTINKLVFEIHTEVFDEFGDGLPVHKRFTADRSSRVLTMADFDQGGVEHSLTLDGRKMSVLLLWAVRSLEIFMWEEDYNLGPNDIPPYFDLLPEFWPDDDCIDEDTEEDIPEEDVCWRVQIEYTDFSTHEIVSCQEGLPDRPEELYWAMMDYLGPENCF
jgi:hypothetical protein